MKKSERMHPAPTVGVIGCGAVAASFHVPALARHRELRERLVLVDPDEGRARALAARHGIARTSRDLTDCLEELDAAVVCAPHRFHYELSRACLEAGVDVLCEKPLTETAEQARELVELADRQDAVLCVNHPRRLYPVNQKVRELIADGTIGELRALRYTWGEKFEWPAATGGYFGQASGGRGVLFDKGPHLLDLICWWLSGKPRLVSYRDDAMGGSEAVAELRFEHRGCQGEVRLSWLSRYDNRFVVEGESGRVEGELFNWRTLTRTAAGGEPERLRLESSVREPGQFANAMIDGFVAAVRGDAPPPVAAREVIDSMALMEECYRSRRRFELPWHDTLDRVLAS